MKCICIACSRELANLLEDGLQPSRGVAFHSPGHYGSTIFDPMDGSELEIVVCDDCLVKAGKEGRVARLTVIQHRSTQAHLWEPKETGAWETVESET